MDDLDLNTMRARAMQARSNLQKTLSTPLTPASPTPTAAAPQTQPASWLSKLDFSRARPTLAAPAAMAPAGASIRHVNSKNSIQMFQNLLNKARTW